MDQLLVHLVLFVLLLICIYKFTTRKDENFFQSRGVKDVYPSTAMFRNFMAALVGRHDGMTSFQKVYDSFRDQKIFGAYIFSQPIFVVKDPDLIKQIMIKNFDNFTNHDEFMVKGVDKIFGKSVLLLESDQWREMRNVLSPMFTPARLKVMHNQLMVCAEDLLKYFAEVQQKESKIIIDPKEIFGKYTAESIAITSLGFRGFCIAHENTEVYNIALNIQRDFTDFRGLLKMYLIPVFPKLAKLFKIQIFRQSTLDFFKEYVIDEMIRRRWQNIKNATDLIQLLTSARETNQLKLEYNDADEKALDWNDDELIAAQVLVMFAGGFETTSTLMQMCCWELAMNQDIQAELIQEVDDTVNVLNGRSISQKMLSDMKFLDMVVNETLRKWPSVTFGNRSCSKDITIDINGDDSIHFKEGDVILVPIRSIQHDENYFENPAKFDPRRFSDGIEQGTFLSFGIGPRSCLGARFALLQAKLALFTTLSKYSIEICEKTPMEVKYTRSALALMDNIFVELKGRSRSGGQGL